MVPLESIPQTAKLSGNEMRLLLALEHHCRDKPSCFPGNQRLASLVGCTERRVRSTLASLEEKGWVRRVINEATRDREEIVMLRRIDPRLPAGCDPKREDGSVPLPGRTESSGHNHTSAVARPWKQHATYSASADRCPRGRGRSPRSAGDVARPSKSDRMRAPEMDAAILDYAEVAGSDPPPSPWSEAEPF